VNTEVSNSFRRIKQHDRDVGVRFYRALFSAHPSLRELFPPDIAAQAAKFSAMLEAVVHNDTTGLAALGEQHRALGVSPEQYPIVAALLLDTLAASDDEWSDDVASAWRDALQHISNAMLARRV